MLAHEQFDPTLSEADKREIEKYKAEFDTIGTQVNPLYKKLRDIQTRYLAEYEGELADAHTGKASMNRYKEELYFLINCEIGLNQSRLKPLYEDLASHSVSDSKKILENEMSFLYLQPEMDQTIMTNGEEYYLIDIAAGPNLPDDLKALPSSV